MKIVGIYVGPYYRHWDETNLNKGIGGSETWAIEVAKVLSKYYKVIVYANPEENHFINENLELVSHHQYRTDIEQGMRFNYFIFSRYTDVIHPYLKCNNVYVMVHDIYCLSQEHIGLGRVKQYGYLSEWHKEYLINYHKGLRPQFLSKVSNGFSKELYDKYKDLPKTKSMVWSSSLVRGFFDIYNYVLFDLIKLFPEFIIHVCCGTISDQDRVLLDRAKILPNVIVHDTLPKEELAKLQCQAKLWIYPGTFPETFCITSLENAYAGNYIIAPGSYGLKTTLEGYSGFEEFGYDPFTEEDRYKCIDAAISALNDSDSIKPKIEEAKAIANLYSWERAAQEWIEIFKQCDKTIV